MTNPFAQNVPAQQQPPPAAPAQNPYTQPAQRPQAAPNPFAQQPAAPAAPQAYAPAQQAPAYAPQQHQYAPPAQAQQHAGPPMSLGAATAPPPPPPSGGKGANMADMYGRLVIIFPHTVQSVPKRANFITDEQRARGELNQDRMTATVVVLDGGSIDNMTPIQFGGNPHVLGGRPHDQNELLPYVRKAMWINQSKVILQVSDYMPGRAAAGPNGSPGAAVGRLVKEGIEANSAWYLTTPTEDELRLANDYLRLVMENRFPHPLAP